MKYGLVYYPNTYNLGDDIQSYACENFLPHTDYMIDRENLDGFYTKNGELVAVIMGGWYLYNHLNWPPSPFIKPLPISMHFDTYYSKVAGERITKNFVVEDYGRYWLQTNGPVGCRDYGTLDMFQKAGIQSYFSGCITLTFHPFEDVEDHGDIVLVDVSDDICSYVEKRTMSKCVRMTHSIKMDGIEWERRRRIVEERLRYYQGAKLVITPRLHAALPCLALGIPVLFIREDWSLNRTETWLAYVNHVTEESLLTGERDYDFDNPEINPDRYKELALDMEQKCRRFIEQCEQSVELERLDVNMFLEGLKRTNRLKKLMELRVDKYERKLQEKICQK